MVDMRISFCLNGFIGLMMMMTGGNSRISRVSARYSAIFHTEKKTITVVCRISRISREISRSIMNFIVVEGIVYGRLSRAKRFFCLTATNDEELFFGKEEAEAHVLGEEQPGFGPYISQS